MSMYFVLLTFRVSLWSFAESANDLANQKSLWAMDHLQRSEILTSPQFFENVQN